MKFKVGDRVELKRDWHSVNMSWFSKGATGAVVETEGKLWARVLFDGAQRVVDVPYPVLKHSTWALEQVKADARVDKLAAALDRYLEKLGTTDMPCPKEKECKCSMSDDILPYGLEELDGLAGLFKNTIYRNSNSPTKEAEHITIALNLHRAEVERLALRPGTGDDAKWMLLNYLKRIDDIVGVLNRMRR